MTNNASKKNQFISEYEFEEAWSVINFSESDFLRTPCCSMGALYLALCVWNIPVRVRKFNRVYYHIFGKHVCERDISRLEIPRFRWCNIEHYQFLGMWILGTQSCSMSASYALHMYGTYLHVNSIECRIN